MEKSNVTKMIEKYGYTRTKKKLRAMGIPKSEVFKMTDFLFKEI